MNLSDTISHHWNMVRRRWVERLYEDFDHICFTYRVKLARPVVRVTDMTSHWGQWDPLTKTITIASKLIQTYPWDVVIEILKHEMAHQIVSEVFRGDEAHGPEFKRACGMLAVAHWAAAAETDLSAPLKTEVIAPAPDASEERLLKRVEKLLALAGSANEHEAVLAMQKVQELYAKYNLDRLRDNRKDQHVYLLIRTGKKRLERYHYLICSILNEHFFVQVIHTSLYDAREFCEFKAVELLGTQENVLMAEYVYHFLLNQITMLWNGFRRDRKKTLRSRNSYFLGVLSGFRDKLDVNREQVRAKAEQQAKAQAGGGGPGALLVIEDLELENFVSFRYPRLVKIRGRGSLRDSPSFEAGRAAGWSLVLHRGIKGSEGNRGRLLTR